MDIFNIIREAFIYPVNDLKGWGIIASIFIIPGILEQLAILYPKNSIIFHVLSFIVSILLMGIGITIIKDTIDGGYQIPMINPMKNFIDGIKVLVVNIVYYIIPAIIIFIISIIAGVFSNVEKFVLSLNATTTVNSTAANMLSTVPTEVTQALVGSIALVAIISIILFVLFDLFLIIAQARLAETDDIISALNIKDVVNKIMSIGIANYVLFIILLLLTSFVIALFSGFVTLIPFIGRIIAAVALDSYLLIVVSRAVGLIYNEG